MMALYRSPDYDCNPTQTRFNRVAFDMGNFAGHVDEGIVFFLVALWWMYKIYRSYIQCLEEKRSYRSHVSYYTVFKERRLPLELVLKILFPIAGILAEIFSIERIMDKEGKFASNGGFFHIGVFSLFVLHGLSDFLEYCRYPAIKGMKYFILAVAFIWYGIAFYLHGMRYSDKPLELTLHRFLVPLLMISGICALFEYASRNSIIPQIARCFCVLCVGEWIIITSFVLDLPTPFPGSRRNPAWDLKEMSNVTFIETAFGFMLVVNIAFMMISYTLMALYMKYVRGNFKKTDLKYKYTQLTDAEMNEF